MATQRAVPPEDIEQWREIAYQSGAKIDKAPLESDREEPEQEEETEDLDDEECVICEEIGELLLCEGSSKVAGCDRGFHLQCIHREAIPKGDWLCQECSINAGWPSVGIEGLEFDSSTGAAIDLSAGAGAAIDLSTGAAAAINLSISAAATETTVGTEESTGAPTETTAATATDFGDDLSIGATATQTAAAPIDDPMDVDIDDDADVMGDSSMEEMDDLEAETAIDETWRSSVDLEWWIPFLSNNGFDTRLSTLSRIPSTLWNHLQKLVGELEAHCLSPKVICDIINEYHLDFSFLEWNAVAVMQHRLVRTPAYVVDCTLLLIVVVLTLLFF